MSAISLKSITGITSITTPAGVDNQLTLHSNNTAERLRITSSGAVGINTTVDAATKLQVQTDATSTTAGGNVVARFQSNGSGRDATIQLSDNVAHSATISMLSSALIFKQSGTETFHITSGGNVGVNTSSESIAGMSRYLSVSARNVTNGGAALELVGARTGSDQTLGVINFVNQTSKVAEIRSKYQGSTTLGSLHFQTSGTERLQITSSGDLSLRTTTQNSFLGLTANSTAINLTLGSTTGTHPRAYFYGTGNGQSTAGDIFMGTGVGGDLRLRSGGAIKLQTNSDNSTIDAFFVHAAGTVAVNTFSPDTTYKLDVVGAGQFTTSTTNQQNDFLTGQLTVKNDQSAQGAFIDFRADSNNGTQGVIAKIGGFNTYNGSGYDGLLTFSTRQNSNNTMVERVRITSAGRVGVNVSDPDSIFETVSPATNGINAHIGGLYNDAGQSAVRRIEFGVKNYRNAIQSQQGSGGSNFSSDNDLLLNPSGGKIGIGTDIPTYKLHVDSGDAAIGLWKSRRSSGSFIDYSVGANGAALGFIGAGGQIISSGGADSGDFAIRSEGDLLFSSGGSVERTRLDNSGRLLHGNASSTGVAGHGVRIQSDAVGSNYGEGALALRGTGGDFYAITMLGNSGNAFGVLPIFSSATDRLDIGYYDGPNASNSGALVSIKQTGKVDVAGNIAFTNGSGIDFSAETDEGGSTRQGAILADYEEGIWTPTNTIGMTLTVNNGAHYIKIGKQVTVWFDITLTGNPDSAQCASIENLPYVSKSSNTYYGQSNMVWYSTTAGTVRDYDDDNTLIFVNNNSTTIRIWNVTSGHDRVRSWANGRRFRGTVTYIAKN